MRYLYFAYGSNLNVPQMLSRCPGSVKVSPAVLHNYRLAERLYADIEPAAGEFVHGALYDISENDLASLDRYEGFPRVYTRKEVLVTDSCGIYCKALVYIMTEETARSRARGKFPEDYRQVCSEGAKSWGIPDGFSPQVQVPSTLWEKGRTPDIAAGLEAMLACLDTGAIPRAKRLWCGADVIISLTPQITEEAFGFYPAPVNVATPHALELSWVFCDLRDLFKGKLDSMNKYRFYGELAETAMAARGGTAADLCRKVILKAREFTEA